MSVQQQVVQGINSAASAVSAASAAREQPVAGETTDRRELAIRRAEKLAKWMDDAYLDPLVGMALPGAGDLITLVPSLYILLVGLRNGVPKVVLARMLLNLTLDTVAGSVPVVGDLFDAGYKSNKRNAALLRQRQGQDRGKARDWLVVGGALALFLFAQAIPIAILVGILAAIF